MHLFVLERLLHGSPAALDARNMARPRPEEILRRRKTFPAHALHYVLCLYNVLLDKR